MAAKRVTDRTIEVDRIISVGTTIVDETAEAIASELAVGVAT